MYTIKVDMANFAPLEYPNMQLSLAQELTLDFEPQAAGVSENVTVTAEAPVLDLSSARIGVNVSEREVLNLPVNGRQMSQLMLQAPGSQNAGTGTWQDPLSFGPRGRTERHPLRFRHRGFPRPSSTRHSGNVNAHAREADPGLRLHGYPERHFGGADIHHDRGTRLPELAHRRSRDVEGNRSLIDAANIAFGAGDRDIGPGLELLGRVRRAHHGGYAQFPRHDGRMAGPAALVGDDAGGDLHDRLPIRTGGRRDQDLARFEGCEVSRGRNAARAPGGDFFPYRAAGDDDGPVPLESVGLVDQANAARPPSRAAPE